MPGAVTAAVQALREHPEAGMVCADAYLIDAQGIITREWKGRPFDIQQVITSEGFIRQPTVFIRRSTLAAVGLLDEKLHMSMDYDLWVRIGLRFPVVYLADIYIAQAREHSEAKSTAKIADFPNDRRRTLNKVFHDERTVQCELQRLRPTAYAAVSFTQAVLNAYVGRPGEIIRPLLRAFVESPMYVLGRPLPTAGLIARSCMPFWSGPAPAPVVAVWRRVTPDK
jgi:GT2 family glycosyltransferase